MTRAALAPLAVALALAGCHPPPPPPPLLTLGDRACDAAPDLASAKPVPFDDSAGATVELDTSSRCLRPSGPGGPAVPYAVFRLPDHPGPIAVTFSSAIVGEAVIHPVVTVLDEQGRQTRAFAPDSILRRASGYEVGLRADPAQRYLVAAADPAGIGGRETFFISDNETGLVRLAHGYTAPAPIILVPPPPAEAGSSASHVDAIHALNGRFIVVARPIPVIRTKT